MDAQIVSELLSQAHVWHKTQNNSITTKRTTTPIPEINNKIAYLAGVIIGDGSLNSSKRKKGG
jgi:hypothetical protein